MTQTFHPGWLVRSKLHRQIERANMASVKRGISGDQIRRKVEALCFKYGVFVQEKNGKLIELQPKWICKLLNRPIPYTALARLDRIARLAAMKKRVVFFRGFISFLQSLPDAKETEP